jgi:tRNA(fMet)-specific endonuclease VapC
MRILLDTNIILAYLREKTMITDFVDTRYIPFGADTETLVSIVSVGELEALALSNQWGAARYAMMNQLFEKFIIADINYRPIVLRYAQIDAYSQGCLPNQPLSTSARNMGKNDIWIAATASVLEATLITTGADFGHLQDTFLSIEQVSQYR